MKTYSQFGKFSVIILLPLFIITLLLLLLNGFDDGVMDVTFGFVVLTILICLLIFYRLTISIDNTHLSFKLGIGLVTRKYLLTDIKTCKPVRNSLIYGVGIRLLPDGWLYNVSGSYAIELTFKNRKTKIRIGTDKPEEIASEINKLIQADSSGVTSDYTEKSHAALILIIISIAMILPATIVLSGKRAIVTTITDTQFIIKGMYGMEINFTDIIQLDTISDLPAIRKRTNGYSAGNTLKGNFTLADNRKVKLFITKGVSPYIFIRTKNLQLYLNFKESGKTKKLFLDLKQPR